MTLESQKWNSIKEVKNKFEYLGFQIYLEIKSIIY